MDAYRAQMEVLDGIQKALKDGSVPVRACKERLQEVKRQVAGPSLAAYSSPDSNVSLLVVARTAYETAAMLDVVELHQLQASGNAEGDEAADAVDSFQRHISLLSPFYSEFVQSLACDFQKLSLSLVLSVGVVAALDQMLLQKLPPSRLQLELQALHLLHLLASDRIGELHVAFDRLPEETQKSPYIQTVMQLEQRLMVGSYGAIMEGAQKQLDLPVSAGVFLRQLTNTARLLVAAALEASYESLPLLDAAKMLRLSVSELSQFAEQQNARRRSKELLAAQEEEAASAEVLDGSRSRPHTLSAGVALANMSSCIFSGTQQQQSVSTLAAGFSSGSFASACSFERAEDLGVEWIIREDRLLFKTAAPPTAHCALHAKQVASQLIDTELQFLPILDFCMAAQDMRLSWSASSSGDARLSHAEH